MTLAFASLGLFLDSFYFCYLDGLYIVSASHDGTIKLWSRSSGDNCQECSCIERQWDSAKLNPENIGASENRGSCLVQRS